MHQSKQSALHRRPRIIVGLTGSVATVKWASLASSIAQFADVCVIVTRHATHFTKLSHGYDAAAWAALQQQQGVAVVGDEDEWSHYHTVGHDEVVHIELRKWADALVIAPLSANTLGKVSCGLCDNLLTCVARAWFDGSGKPFLVAPAMNSAMWTHPFTANQLNALSELGIVVIPPISKILACGDIGTGAMADVATIAEQVRARVVDFVQVTSASGTTPGRSALPAAVLQSKCSPFNDGDITGPKSTTSFTRPGISSLASRERTGILAGVAVSGLLLVSVLAIVVNCTGSLKARQ
jgi:phosphopantothenoylcysteine decarboxylase